MSFGRVLNIVRKYTHDEGFFTALNLTHIVSLNQNKNFLFFQTVSNREISISFSDEDIAKKELFDIVDTLNAYFREKQA